MKKMLKIMAMLLVIATVIFAAGCAEKKESTGAEKNATSEAPEKTVGQENLSVNATNDTIGNNTTGNETNVSLNTTDKAPAEDDENATGTPAEDDETANETPTEGE